MDNLKNKYVHGVRKVNDGIKLSVITKTVFIYKILGA